MPAFEPDTTVPATTSHNILTGLLRDEMKFKGLVVTDAMDMGGVTSLYPPGEAAIRAVGAGADVLLMPPVPDAALAGLERAVRSGRLSEGRIDQSVRRILLAKARLGLDKNRFANIEQLDQKFGRPEFESQAQSIADRGVTLLRDTPHLLTARCDEAVTRSIGFAFRRSRIRTRERPSSRKFAGAWIR